MVVLKRSVPGDYIERKCGRCNRTLSELAGASANDAVETLNHVSFVVEWKRLTVVLMEQFIVTVYHNYAG